MSKTLKTLQIISKLVKNVLSKSKIYVDLDKKWL